MPKYILDIGLDGFDNEKDEIQECNEFIYDQLNHTASSINYTAIDNEINDKDFKLLLDSYFDIQKLLRKKFKADFDIIDFRNVYWKRNEKEIWYWYENPNTDWERENPQYTVDLYTDKGNEIGQCMCFNIVNGFGEKESYVFDIRKRLDNV